ATAPRAGGLHRADHAAEAGGGAASLGAVSIDLVLRLRFERRLELPIDEVGWAESSSRALRLQGRGEAVFVLGAGIVLSGDGTQRTSEGSHSGTVRIEVATTAVLIRLLRRGRLRLGSGFLFSTRPQPPRQGNADC